MAEHTLKIWFYERDQALSLPVEKDDYDKLIENLKQLASGHQDIPSYFVLKASEKVSVLISVKDIVALYSMTRGKAELQPVDGAKVVLRHLPTPVEIAFDEHGPFPDLLEEMSEMSYAETPEGCVMMPDTEDGSIFFRPDDLQYVIFNARYLDPA